MQTQAPLDSRAIVLTEIEAMGGAERSVLALSRWLAQRGLRHHFVTYVDHAGMATHADHPIEVVQLRPEMRARRKIAGLRRYFASARGPFAPLMSGFQPALHATLAGLRGFHCLMHDTPSLFEEASALTLKQKINRLVSDRITAYGLASGGRTIVTSQYLRDECRRVFDVEADIARMGGLSNSAAFQLRPVQEQLHMLSVSRIEASKRVDWMLRALSAMEAQATPLSTRIDWSLRIAGRGSQLEAMQRLAARLGLHDRVRFLGYVSDQALEQLYAETQLFLMPAVQGYGIPAVEALARGVPVLLHRESGVSDILRSTPWATVLEGGEQSMLPGLEAAIEKVLTGAQLSAPLPVLPTEEEWAERVCRLCSWA